MDSSNFLGDEVFFNDHNSTINTLVVCNFAWYRPYLWHIPQLSSDVTDGPVRVLNFAELCDTDGNKLSRFAAVKLLVSIRTRMDRIIFDGYVGFWFYVLIIGGFFGRSRIILATINFTAPKFSLRDLIKFLFLRAVFKKVDKIVVASEISRALMRQIYSREISDKILVAYPPINFESVSEFLPPAVEWGDYIFAGGQANRDYELMFQAVEGISTTMLVNCPRKVFDLADCDDNVRHVHHNNTFELIEQIRDCKFLVVPLKPSLDTTGLRIIYWGLELGKAMVVSNTLPIQEIFGNDPPFLTCECSSGSDMQAKIIELDSNEELVSLLGGRARGYAIENLTSEAYINGIWEFL